MAQPTCTQTLGERVHFTQYGNVIRVHIRTFYRGDKSKLKREWYQFCFLLSLGLPLMLALALSYKWNTQWAAILGFSLWAVLIIANLIRYISNRYGVETITMEKNRMKYAAALQIDNKRYVLFCKNLQGNLSIALKPEMKPILHGPKIIPDSGRRIFISKQNKKIRMIIQLDKQSGGNLIQLMKNAYA
jgi:hypothetical protein